MRWIDITKEIPNDDRTVLICNEFNSIELCHDLNDQKNIDYYESQTDAKIKYWMDVSPPETPPQDQPVQMCFVAPGNADDSEIAIMYILNEVMSYGDNAYQLTDDTKARIATWFANRYK